MATAVSVETLNKIHCIFKYHGRSDDASETRNKTEFSIFLFFIEWFVRGIDGTLTAIDSLHGVVIVNIVVIIGNHFDLFLYLQMWGFYSCLQLTFNRPISQQFTCLFIILKKKTVFYPLFFKNGQLQITHWVVFKFRIFYLV